jgi:hypothetical protein
MHTTLLENYSPLDQFEIRDLFSLDAPLLGNTHFSITNIGLYLTIGASIAFLFKALATNYNRVVSNNWSVSQETIYATVHSIVVGQINAREGQVYFPFIYALFVFILVNNLIGMVRRCLFVIIYDIYIYILCKFYLFSLFSTKKNIKINKKVRHYTYNRGNATNIINPYYITGFSDGEACFALSIYKDSRMLTGWQVKPFFKISLHNKDRALLELIQRYFGVGKIYKHGKDSAEFRVSGLKNLSVIINHFDKYPLITQKLADYLLFKQAVKLVQEKVHLTKKGLLKIVSIKASLNLGLSEQFKESFPNVIPVIRPSVKFTGVKDLNWFRGFVEAEGCFLVVVQEYKDKPASVSLRFFLTQHSRDRVLLESFVNYLGYDRFYSVTGRNEVYFIISTFKDIFEKVIPLFYKYPLLGSKQQDFFNFVKVAELIRSKDHLTKKGLEKIKLIKSNMNSRRDHSILDYTTE